MTDPTALPLALHQANLDLQVRLGELLQAGGRHWFEFVQRLVNDGIVENGAELQALMQTRDWQKLASLPADAFWRQVQQRFGDQQAAAQIAVAAQSSFAHGLQDALARWQHETIAAMDQAGFGLAAPAVDADWAALFGVAAAPAREPAAPAAAKKTPRKAPAKQAAARKATAKPATKKAAKKAPARATR